MYIETNTGGGPGGGQIGHHRKERGGPFWGVVALLASRL